jgi:thiol-disulfide isomerase/thioredoxin
LQTPAKPATESGATSGKSGPSTKPGLAQEKASVSTAPFRSAGSVPVAGNGAVTVGQRLPDFLFTGLNGNTMTEGTLRGHKTLFIIVSPTCPHCQKELKLLHEIVNDYPSIEPVFASVFPLDQTRPLADMTGEGDHIYTGARELAQDLGVTGVPFLMLIDEKGVVRAIRKGELEEPAFRDILGKFARGEAVPQVSRLMPFLFGNLQGERA